MNALSQAIRRQPPKAVSRRTNLFLSHPHGRSVAYRRLLSTRTGGTPPTTAIPLITSRSSTVPQLGSNFSFEQTRCGIPFVRRQLHAATWLRQDAKTTVNGKAKAAAQAAQESRNDGATDDGSRTRRDQNQSQQTDGNGRQKEEDGKKAKQEGNEQHDGEQKDGEQKDGEQKDGEQGDKTKEPPPPPPPHGEKTPWQVFMETMSSEFEKSKEWNDTTKAIASSAHQFTESESVRRAREAYEKTSGAASTAVKTTAGAIGKGAQWTWESSVVKGVRKAANVTGDAVEKATRPIRETEAYKNVRDVIDDGSSSRYGGWVEKEERRKRREAELEARGLKTPEKMEEDPNAGTNITLHKDAKWKEAWRDFRDNSKVVQGFFTMGQAYQESENPLVSTARLVTDKIGSFFAENETALVIKKIRTMDPAFQMEPFLRDLREYILPEVLDAYVKGDTETLRLWLSAAQYSVYEALTKQYLQAGMRSDGRVLDIRHVDIVRARLLEPGDVPVFIIMCRTQEVHVYRNAKSGELAAGMEDKVQLVTYAIGVTRVPEDVNNPETRGWRLIEMQKSARDWH